MAKFFQSLAAIRGKLQRGMQLDRRDQLFLMDNFISGQKDMGSFDASSNTFPTAGGSGNNGTIQKGDTFQISVAGTLGSTAVAVGQTIRALKDNAENVAADWSIGGNVGTTATQTLTNKTLTAPVFSSSPTGDGVTQWAEVSLTNAEMLALRATPKTLVAAPGAGKVLEFVGAQLYFDYTAAYTESADNMAIKYENGAGAAASQTIEATGFVDATADTITNALPKIDTIVAKTGSENKALVLHNTGDGEYGGGNAANAVRVKIAYRVWSTGF